MKRRLLQLSLLAIAVALAGLLFAWSGLFNVAASSSHWAITRWFLHFGMRNSVETYSLGIETPRLEDLAMVQRGAGHYETGCAPCHGGPGVPRSAIARGMTPPPPDLVPVIGTWEPEELFWIVKHGIKYTGMPAWAAPHRDDEVWSMVAFLRRLPELKPAEYRELAHGSEAKRDSASADGQLQSLLDPLGPPLVNCVRCHGRDGTGRGTGAFPLLAGQSALYLYESLRAYAAGRRASGIMAAAASGLSDQDMRSLARHYASQPTGLGAASAASAQANHDAIREGETIARNGLPRRGVPPCSSCHGPAPKPRNPIYPRLAGQHADYLATQLRLLQADVRGGTPYAHIMATIAQRLTAEQVESVTLYYNSLGRRGQRSRSSPASSAAGPASLRSRRRWRANA